MGSFLFLIQYHCEKQRVCYESGSDPSAAFGLLSGHTCSFLGNYLSDFHRFPVKRKAVAFGEGGGWERWFEFVGDESAADEVGRTDAGSGRTNRL